MISLGCRSVNTVSMYLLADGTTLTQRILALYLVVLCKVSLGTQWTHALHFLASPTSVLLQCVITNQWIWGCENPVVSLETQRPLCSVAQEQRSRRAIQRRDSFVRWLGFIWGVERCLRDARPPGKRWSYRQWSHVVWCLPYDWAKLQSPGLRSHVQPVGFCSFAQS